MKKTVLITGSSSGIGRASVKYFQKKGWNVVATMRKPEQEKELTLLENVICLKLDVTRPETIQKSIGQAIERFGHIDAVVNNAGYGLFGPFESTTREQVERQFNTNVFGVMEVVRQILPHFREKKEGTIINITSVGGRMTFPLFSLYHASKFAIEGFSESIHYELLPFNIRVKIVEPGAVRTEFMDRSSDRAGALAMDAYRSYVEKGTAYMDHAVQTEGSDPEVIARTIVKAASDASSRLRYAAGRDASILLPLRKFIPDSVFLPIVRKRVMG